MEERLFLGPLTFCEQDAKPGTSLQKLEDVHLINSIVLIGGDLSDKQSGRNKTPTSLKLFSYSDQPTDQETIQEFEEEFYNMRLL